MSELIIKMKDISKSFSGIKALNKVNIEFRKGEIHALMGENGAGKSTLMKILTGIYSKDEGEIYLLNEETKKIENIDIISPLLAQELGISMVFQELNLLDNRNIAENVFIGREPVKNKIFMDDKQLIKNTKKELEKVMLNIDPRVLVSTLSSGQKQSVEIAKALSLNVRVVIFDEPTARLSETESQILFQIIRDLKENNVCVIYISHRMEEVFELSDKITVLRNGNYIDTVNTKNINEKELIKMMIDKELVYETQTKNKSKQNEIVLEVRNINILNNKEPINFKLYKNEILGFFGLVGSGRTELAKSIFGIDPIDNGEIFVKNKKVFIKNPGDAINAGIGLVPEDRKNLGLISKMSIKDNILISRLRRMNIFLNKKKLSNISVSYISDLNIALRDENQEVNELSGGNQQKVVIAKWLSMSPDILIMDEPTRGIDIGSKNEIYNLMKELTDAGKSIIMISSEIEEIMQISDRILVMHEGEISSEFKKQEISKNNIMTAAFGRNNNEEK